jgi:putative N6-adenine-specific DNA methylase
MKKVYKVERFPETGDSYPVRVFLMKDEVTAALDTTGESLHKRGYRKYKVTAPIAENLAAGLLALTPWRPGRILVDPFCGSGTFPIEAAMIAANIAPGVNRTFTAETWKHLVSPSLWKDSRDEALDLETPDIETDLQGYDIDPEAIAAARANAKLAGVDHLIHFQTRPVSKLSHPRKYGFIVTNPPYGERLTGSEEDSIKRLYKELGDAYRKLDTWSMYLITSFSGCEEALGVKAAKNRKIYNGMLKTYFYMFPGPKPPRKSGN